MNNLKVDLSVIVPTHNRADALKLTLQKLAEQNFQGTWEVIVVNNNCTDDTNEVIEKQKINFPVLLNTVFEETPGASAARNAGAAAAIGEYLIFIDNDILGSPNLLQNHYDALKENPQCWIVGQVTNLPEQEKTIFGRYRKELFPLLPISNEPIEINGITGQNVSMPRCDFEKLGGFDENFHVASGEDQELLMRGRKQLGIKALLVPHILVIHNDWAGWTFRDFCERQSKYANTEYLFWKKYGDEHPRLRLVEENLPVDWHRDSAKLKFRKLIKQFLATRSVQSILINTSLLAEKLFPFKFFLWRLYKLSLAGAIHRGFEAGRLKEMELTKLSFQKLNINKKIDPVE